MDFHWLIGTLSGKKELILVDSLIVNDLDTILWLMQTVGGTRPNLPSN